MNDPSVITIEGKPYIWKTKAKYYSMFSEMEIESHKMDGWELVTARVGERGEVYTVWKKLCEKV